MLTQEEQDARRQRYYQDQLDCILSIREGDVLYHATLQENIPSLLHHGFDPKRIGTGGGCQGGIGLSAAWCKEDALHWGERIWGYHAGVVKLSLPGMKLASHQQFDEMAKDVYQWAKTQGYLHLTKNGEYDVTEKLTQLYRDESALVDIGWALFGLYVQSQGYDGYFVGINEVVIMNFSLLTPKAFSLVVE